ncbi:MAG: universal stress protein [Myxococcales bacterium]|nr:universal stress protein [Myxococcales bacterium]MCB9737240.1 universal stress protein [Deltaproteobacteria bacterium]
MATRWLVAYDFSPQAEHAVEVAVAQLVPRDGELILAHVHRPLSSSFGAEFASLSPAFTEVEVTVAEAATARLKSIADRLAGQYPGLKIQTLVGSGDPAEVIASMAADEEVEQIVVGSHGRRGLKRFFLGSVAERVVREADRNVLVVKTPNPDE